MDQAEESLFECDNNMPGKGLDLCLSPTGLSTALPLHRQSSRWGLALQACLVKRCDVVADAHTSFPPAVRSHTRSTSVRAKDFHVIATNCSVITFATQVDRLCLRLCETF